MIYGEHLCYTRGGELVLLAVNAGSGYTDFMYIRNNGGNAYLRHYHGTGLCYSRDDFPPYLIKYLEARGYYQRYLRGFGDC